MSSESPPPSAEMVAPKPIIYYLDDQPEGRRDLRVQLRSLFGELYEVVELPLEPVEASYVRHLEGVDVVGIFIDQNLDETGEITDYTGVKLATFLRSVYPAMPIYLVTGHLIAGQGELDSEEAGNADSVVEKQDLVIDTPTAKKFRLQFLRRVDQYDRALSTTQRRFRELLARKFGPGLDPAEVTEFEDLRLSRELPADVAEEATATAVNEQIEKISGLLAQVRDVRARTQG